MTAPTLRGYQLALVETLRQQFRFYKRTCCVLPTGGGKTVIAGHLAKRSIDKGSRTLFLAHRVELIDQTSAKLDLFGVPHGVIKAHHRRADPSQPMQVASVQTLARRLGKADESDQLWGGCRPTWQRPYDLIIVDECHHTPAGQYQAIIDCYPDARLLGLTATPYRLDGRGLGDHFDHLVIGTHVPELIAAGWLVPTRTYAPAAKDLAQRLAHVHTRHGEYSPAEADEVLNTTGPIDEIVATWRERAADRLTVAFACTVAHAEALAAAFTAAGIRAAAIDGETPCHQRDEVLEQLRDGRLRVVVNCQLLTEGWDLPAIGCVILARPTKSRALWRQMVGRGMRSHPGKVDCVVLDHAANALRFGIADEADHYTLEREVRDAPESHVQECPHCRAIVSETATACPSCACVLRRVGHGGGGRGESAVANWSERDAAILGEFKGLTERDREAWYQHLLDLAREKKYAAGWAAYRYKDRFGRWPLSSWRKERVSA